MILVRPNKPSSRVEILYICSQCSNKQVFNYAIAVDNLPKDLVPALSFDKCNICNTYFRPSNAVFIAIIDPKEEHNV